MTASKRLIPAFFVFLWATGFIGAGYSMPWSEPFSFLAVRFSLAFAILGLVMLFMRSARLSARDILVACMAGVLMHGIYLGGVFWAVRHGMPAGLSGLIVGLQPLLTALLAGAFLGERVLARHWFGLLVGFVGVVIVLSPKLGSLSGGVTVWTLTATFIAVAGMSAGTIWQKRFLGGVNLVRGTFWQYVAGAALMWVLSFAFETREFTLNSQLVLTMAWLVFVLSIGAIGLLMVMIRDGEMAKVASLFYLVPGVTAVLAWWLFDEELSLIQIGGMVLASFGVALATRRTPAKPDQADTLARASR